MSLFVIIVISFILGSFLALFGIAIYFAIVDSLDKKREREKLQDFLYMRVKFLSERVVLLEDEVFKIKN